LDAVFTDRKVLSWALYDWGNSAFSTTVMAAFFPAFYKEYWSAGVDASTSTFQLGVANSLASVCIVVLAPVLGATPVRRANALWLSLPCSVSA